MYIKNGYELFDNVQVKYTLVRIPNKWIIPDQQSSCFQKPKHIIFQINKDNCLMQEPNRAKAKHILDEQHPISKANNFLNRYAQAYQPNRKYTQQKEKQFIKQYKDLTIFQKYNCCELLLSNAWSYIEEEYYNRAQKQLFLVIPLCKEAHFEFDEFEIEKLFWQAFMTPRLNEEEKNELKKLFIDSGIKVHKQKPNYNNSNGSKRGKKSGFDSFIDKFLCRCCFSTRDRQ